MASVTKAWWAVALMTGAAFATQPAMSAARLPFVSSFENGSFGEWNGGLDASMSVNASTASDGRYSAQSVMTPGSSTDNYKEFVFGDHPRVGGAAVDANNGLWLTFDTRFDTGFRFATGAVAHKVAIINWENSSSLRRYQIIINIWTVPGSAQGEYFVDHLKWNEDRSFNRTMPYVGQNLGEKVKLRYGQWDKLKLYVKNNTLGRNDGIIRLWVNGVLKAEHTNVALRENVAVNANKLIMSNYVVENTASGTQRWDNWRLSETDPDADAAVRPNPPVLNSVQ
ncbi:MAG: heparin lyase I family protein [Steroidobacter sp.]